MNPDLHKIGLGGDWPESGYGKVAGLCEYGNEPSGSIKYRGISWLMRTWALQEGLCSMEPVCLLLVCVCYIFSRNWTRDLLNTDQYHMYVVSLQDPCSDCWGFHPSCSHL